MTTGSLIKLLKRYAADTRVVMSAYDAEEGEGVDIEIAGLNVSIDATTGEAVSVRLTA